MAILNLRSEEPTHDTVEDHTLDETPPGLEAIRAWIRKPRPWLHGVRLWIREFAKWWRAFRKWAAKNAVPAARRATELAASGAEAARALARAGEIAADGAKHIADMGRGWGQTDGRIGRMGKAITSRAGQFRDFSIRSVRTATSAAAVGDALGRFREMLPRRKPLDAGPATGDDDSGPTRRFVPVPPRVIPEAPPEPVPQTPEAAREPVSEPPEAVKQPVSEPPEAQPEPLPETPSPLPEPAPEPVTASNPERPASPPVEGEGPVETPRPSASAALPKEARRAEALAKLPWPFRSRINALRRTTRKDVLRPLIVDIIEERGWTTSADLALLLGVGTRNLGRRHLIPLVEGGVLVRLHPEHARHPKQAYRVNAGPTPDS